MPLCNVAACFSACVPEFSASSWTVRVALSGRNFSPNAPSSVNVTAISSSCCCCGGGGCLDARGLLDGDSKHRSGRGPTSSKDSKSGRPAAFNNAMHSLYDCRFTGCPPISTSIIPASSCPIPDACVPSIRDLIRGGDSASTHTNESPSDPASVNTACTAVG